VCSKKKKSDKNAEKKQKKDLTGPTLLEISEYANKSGLSKCAGHVGHDSSEPEFDVWVAS
jgi:hypothetical protein